VHRVHSPEQSPSHIFAKARNLGDGTLGIQQRGLAPFSHHDQRLQERRPLFLTGVNRLEVRRRKSFASVHSDKRTAPTHTGATKYLSHLQLIRSGSVPPKAIGVDGALL
jgi:hypothetical protein